MTIDDGFGGIWTSIVSARVDKLHSQHVACSFKFLIKSEFFALCIPKASMYSNAILNDVHLQ